MLGKLALDVFLASNALTRIVTRLAFFPTDCKHATAWSLFRNCGNSLGCFDPPQLLGIRVRGIYRGHAEIGARLEATPFAREFAVGQFFPDQTH